MPWISGTGMCLPLVTSSALRTEVVREGGRRVKNRREEGEVERGKRMREDEGECEKKVLNCEPLVPDEINDEDKQSIQTAITPLNETEKTNPH